MGSLSQSTGAGYLGVKTFDEDEARHRREIAGVLNNVLSGKLNNSGSLTLTANAATTTVSDQRIGSNSVILLMPTTANASAALGGLYFDTFDNGFCTAHHANNAQTDRSFRYVVFS